MLLLGYSGWVLGHCYVVTEWLLQLCCMISMIFQIVARVLVGISEWVLRCCFEVTREILDCCYGVAIQFPGYSGWWLGCCYQDILGGCQGPALWLLGITGWLLQCCCMVSRIFQIVARKLLCSQQGFLGGCQGIIRCLQGGCSQMSFMSIAQAFNAQCERSV